VGFCSTSPGWTALLDTLAANKELTFLRDHEQNGLSLQLVLRAPVTLALWIESFMPHLASQAELNILLAGVERTDGRHAGIWYQVLPWLLENPRLKVNVTLLFSTREGQRKANEGLPDLRAAGSYFRPARTAVQTLGRFLEDSPGYNPDLLMLFQPGFDAAIPDTADEKARYSWLSSGQLSRALESGIPVGATAYEEIEYEHERWLLDAYGVRPLGDFVQSQYVVEPRMFVLGGPPIGWGGVLWRLDPASRILKPARTSPIFEAHREFQSKGAGLQRMGNPVDLWNLGRRMTLPFETSRDLRDVIVLADNLAVDSTTGSVERVTDRGRLTPLTSPVKVPARILNTYPDNPEFPFERVLWGVDTYVLVEDLLDNGSSGEAEPDEDEEADGPVPAEFVRKVQAATDRYRKAGKLDKLVEPGFLAARVMAAQALLTAGTPLPDAEMEEIFFVAANRFVATEELERVAVDLLGDYPARAGIGRKILATLCAGDGYPETRANYAVCLFSGDGGAPDFAEARAQCLQILADNRSSEHSKGVACGLLAKMVRYGKDVPADVPAALKLLEQGVAFGNGSCAFELATYWDDGLPRAEGAVSQPEPILSARYYRQAIAMGIDQAMVNLALLLWRHPECMESDNEAPYWLKRAVDGGDEIALDIWQSTPELRKASH
jgi:TPR repeat protein